MYRISKQLASVYLWLSLHDTTPNVLAERQAVYCQTSFPFLKGKWQDLAFDYKIVLFTLFTRFAYRINIHRNHYLIVQAEWLRKGFSKMFGLPQEKFIVATPDRKSGIKVEVKIVQIIAIPFYLHQHRIVIRTLKLYAVQQLCLKGNWVLESLK